MAIRITPNTKPSTVLSEKLDHSDLGNIAYAINFKGGNVNIADLKDGDCFVMNGYMYLVADGKITSVAEGY